MVDRETVCEKVKEDASSRGIWVVGAWVFMAKLIPLFLAFENVHYIILGGKSLKISLPLSHS